MTMLDKILVDVREEIAAAKLRRTSAEIRSMIGDAPPPRSFFNSLSEDFGIIAEIKECSPSVGPMRAENVADAPAVYEASGIVRAVSVLTNARHFGMDINRLAAIRSLLSKPVLRKDFFLDEYQIREARAFGADAVLLMANVLDAARMQGFFDLTRELGMEALFEVHTPEEIETLPPKARVIGINSRKFKSETGFVEQGTASQKDFSLDYSTFELAGKLPATTIKVAESGLNPQNIASLRKHFDAALIGTALLRDERGVEACLEEFSEALKA